MENVLRDMRRLGTTDCTSIWPRPELLDLAVREAAHCKAVDGDHKGVDLGAEKTGHSATAAGLHCRSTCCPNTVVFITHAVVQKDHARATSPVPGSRPIKRNQQTDVDEGWSMLLDSWIKPTAIHTSEIDPLACTHWHDTTHGCCTNV